MSLDVSALDNLISPRSKNNPCTCMYQVVVLMSWQEVKPFISKRRFRYYFNAQCSGVRLLGYNECQQLPLGPLAFHATANPVLYRRLPAMGVHNRNAIIQNVGLVCG